VTESLVITDKMAATSHASPIDCPPSLSLVHFVTNVDKCVHDMIG